MSANKDTASNAIWTDVQAYTLAAVCLVLGVLVGWLVRGSQAPAGGAVAAASTSTASTGVNSQPSADQLRQMADAQAGPLIEKLKSDPKNADLLISVGNSYYDAQQYPAAIDYYQRALKIEPGNTSARTDMATAYWYMGNADTAIAEFQNSLSYDPNKADTLFNLGVVQWQGKMDIDKAVATWQKLLDTNPNYPGKDKVLELIAQAKRHSGVKPGTRAKPLAQGSD